MFKLDKQQEKQFQGFFDDLRSDSTIWNKLPYTATWWPQIALGLRVIGEHDLWRCRGSEQKVVLAEFLG